MVAKSSRPGKQWQPAGPGNHEVKVWIPGYGFSAVVVSLDKNLSLNASATQLLNQDILYIMYSGNILWLMLPSLLK